LKFTPSPPYEMNSRCDAGATDTPLIPSFVCGSEIVFTSPNSWSASYTDMSPSSNTYSRCWMPAPPVTTAVGAESAGADRPAALEAVTLTRTVEPRSAVTSR
jgi:hypothetical protein